MRFFLPLVAVAGAACSPAAPSEENRQLGTQTEPSDSSVPIAGRYEEVRVTDVSIPGQPIEQVSESGDHCWGAKQPIEEVRKDFRRLCASGEIAFRDGKISGQMTCRIPEAEVSGVLVTFSGSYDKGGIDLRTDFNVESISFHQTVTYRRTGTC